MLYLWLFAFGILVGVLGGLLGIGGGILLVPGLMILFGFTQPEAQGTSLAVMIPPIGLFAALVYWQYGYVRLPVVGWVALGFVLGAFVGAKLVPIVPMVVLRPLFGSLLLYTGFLFVLNPGGTKSSAAMPSAVATLVAAGLGWLWGWRRSRTRPPLPPPGPDLDYHI